MLDEYRKRRDSLHEWLTADPRLRVPQAGGRVLPVRRHQRRCCRPAGSATSTDFAQALLDESRVAVTPGEAFDAPGFVRMSYATSMEHLREGSRRLLEFVGSARRRGAAASGDDEDARIRGRRPMTADHGEGRRGDRRVEQSPEVRQPGGARLRQAGLHGHPDQPARARSRRAEEPTRRCSTCPGRSTWRRSTCRPRSASRSSRRSPAKRIAEVWLNPGAESDALIARARRSRSSRSSPAASSPSAESLRLKQLLPVRHVMPSHHKRHAPATTRRPLRHQPRRHERLPSRRRAPPRPRLPAAEAGRRRRRAAPARRASTSPI